MPDGWRKKCSGKRYAAQHRKAARTYYYKNYESIQVKIKARKSALSQWVLNYKTQRGCLKCKETHPYCLEFHHSGEKENTICDLVRWGASKKRILAEIETCVLLCANCHRKLHWPVYLSPTSDKDLVVWTRQDPDSVMHVEVYATEEDAMKDKWRGVDDIIRKHTIRKLLQRKR